MNSLKFVLLALLPGLALCLPATAATVSLNITDSQGKPAVDTVVLIFAKDKNNAPAAKPATASMRQVDKQFSPHVLPVAVGTSVEFPNADNVKHHVYSFSDAKTFELELYDEFKGTPVAFDKPGIVELGCNIHDWMLAYIYVTDADYFFTVAEKGKIEAQLPNGDYTVQLWHPLAADSDTEQITALAVSGQQSVTLTFKQPFEEALDYSDGFDDY